LPLFLDEHRLLQCAQRRPEISGTGRPVRFPPAARWDDFLSRGRIESTSSSVAGGAW
jgi:hypothetical protein